MTQQPEHLEIQGPGERPPDVDDVRELLVRARDGDHRAFRVIVERYRRAVYALAFRMTGQHEDADDMTQEAFVRVYQALDRYDPRYSFYTWIRNIVIRLCANEMAKRARRRTEPAGDPAMFDRVASDDPGPFERLSAAETAERIERALEAVPSDQRQVFVLRVHEEMSYQEIAERLELPVGTVMSRLSRARRAILARLRSEDRRGEESR